MSMTTCFSIQKMMLFGEIMYKNEYIKSVVCKNVYLENLCGPKPNTWTRCIQTCEYLYMMNANIDMLANRCKISGKIM